ncbi:SOS response-associated peptidase [Allostreptomyces psammosilenae]|uniref:Abasic site processing protein n=1 Tax=Allostreptomyces psammosilenae TaxID=1892865 RepID=A0A852ZWF7_9ACTN|nr:SOS response-associated peptidase [Allostreptomyces psammosilenae]NYI06295.1 putative SOS response-associated peptidase YedK [Allostreptomyces psammosilenae]
MCGRYASGRAPDELVEHFAVERLVDDADQAVPVPERDWNVAPTKPVWAVLERPTQESGGPGGRPVRQLRPLRWGLVPSWAKDVSVGARMFNARSESVHEKPAYRRAFAARRCLIPADGYYEWEARLVPGQTDAKRGPGRKQPYWISRADGRPLAFAGLYEFWRDPELPKDDPRSWLWTCTILTTDAPTEGRGAQLGRIHPRMPLELAPDRWEAWLDPTRTDPEELRGLLVPDDPGLLTAHPVSTAVNSVRNNGPELIEPVVEERLF